MKTKTKGLLVALSMLAGFGIEPAVASPIAVISGPYDILAGQTIALSGLLSSDTTPGAVLSYAWDLDNDGMYFDSASATPNFTVGSTAIPGQSFVIGLKVTDNFGASATTLSSVTVVKELPAVVPEPISTALIGVGVVALAATRRKRRG